MNFAERKETEGGDIMKKSNDWLETLRNEKERTMKQVAGGSGISESHYCLIESGDRRPSVDTAKKIAEVLGFDWTKFFDCVQTQNTA